MLTDCFIISVLILAAILNLVLRPLHTESIFFKMRLLNLYPQKTLRTGTLHAESDAFIFLIY